MGRPKLSQPRLRFRGLRIPIALDNRINYWMKGTGHSRTTVLLVAIEKGMDVLEKWQADLNSARARSTRVPRKMGQGRLK